MQSLPKSLMPHSSLSDRDEWKEETNQKKVYSWDSEGGEMLKKELSLIFVGLQGSIR